MFKYKKQASPEQTVSQSWWHHEEQPNAGPTVSQVFLPALHGSLTTRTWNPFRCSEVDTIIRDIRGNKVKLLSQISGCGPIGAADPSVSWSAATRVSGSGVGRWEEVIWIGSASHTATANSRALQSHMCFPSAATPAGNYPNWEQDFGPAPRARPGVGGNSGGVRGQA